jgi:WD40 repeat protein
MPLRIGALALAGATAALVGAPAWAQATFPGFNGRLATVRVDVPLGRFDSDRRLVRARLLTVLGNGRNRRALIRCEGNGCLGGPPAYSPDGKRLAYTRNGKLIVAGADGRGPRVLAVHAGVSASGPQWSPGGRNLVFVGTTKGPADCYLHDAFVTPLDGSATRRLTKRGTVSAIAWSSRGELAFEVLRHREMVVTGADATRPL